MKKLISFKGGRVALVAATIAVATGVLLTASSAQAWVSFGFAFPPIVIAPAPVAPYPYYPYPYYPPAYYAPPPAPAPYQSPAPQLSQNQVPYGATCFAGNYTCSAAPYTKLGAVCFCPGIGAPSYGSVQ